MKTYLTTREAAQQLGISKEWLVVLTNQKRVTPHVSVGIAYGWDPERLEEVRASITRDTK